MILSNIVTFGLISLTLLCFCFFWIRSLKAKKNEITKLKQIQTLKQRFSDGKFDIQLISNDELVWITDHLIYENKGDYYEIEAKNNQWLSKSPLSQMLPIFDSSRYKLVPALLTSIGITGTFLGITLGLSEFSMAGDSKALLASAAELLEGMKTAFYTSLAGLSTSAIFMAIMKHSSSSIAKAQSKFMSEIAGQYLEASPVMYLKQMSNEGQEEAINAQIKSSKAIEGLSGSMNSVVNQLSTLGDSFNGQVIAETISSAVSDSISEQMTPALESIKTELSSLKDIKEQNQKELMELMIGEMKAHLIEPVVIELNKTTEALEKSSKVTLFLNKNVEKVVTQTANTVETIDNFQQETMVKLQSFAESLKDILSSFKDDTQGAMGTIAKEVQLMLNSATEGMDKQRIAFEDSSQSAAQAFDGIKNSMDTALSERQYAEKQLFESVTGRINALLNEISTSFEDQTSVISNTGKAATNLMNQAQTDFEKSVETRREGEKHLLAETEERLKSLINEVSGSFDKQTDVISKTGEIATNLMNKAQLDFEESVEIRREGEKELLTETEERLKSLIDEISLSFDSQTTVISKTGDTAAKLMSQAQDDFEKSVESRREGEKQLFTEMENRISTLLNDSQIIFKQQADTIEKVGSDASTVMISAKTELEQGLGDIDQKVKSMSHTVQTELEAFREQYQQNLTSYFTQQNHLLEDSLGKQRDGLNGVVDNFRQVFESEYQTRHNLLQELTAQHAKLQESAKTIEQVAKAIGLNEASKMAELQDAAQTMGREISQLKLEYSKAAATFNDVTENLPKAMDDYFTRANQSFEGFFTDFDTAASSIHNKLSQAAGYLINSQVQNREFEADKHRSEGVSA
ncbi:hypothetical protein [Aliivibrio fischeri]|uniref:hypothetical protein n=1 Tax=Aliivibrio fischeri TaxID=668 RepID=UPI0007C5036D|nr:hypothetical protein [Aliivibrio fischeri]